MGLIFYLSSLSSPPGQELFPLQDKAEHFALYLILGALLLRALGKQGLGLSALIGCAYAITDELHQGLVPGRATELLDALVDFAAVAAGAGFMSALRRRQDFRAQR